MNNNNFGKDKSKKDGFNNLCKACQKETNSKYYEEHRELLIQNATQYQKNNRDYFNQYKKDWHEDHKEYQNNKRKEWRIKHPEETKKAMSDYWKSNPDKVKMYNENRLHKNHSITKIEWEACKKYFNNQCAYCGLSIENHYIIYNKVTKLGDFHKEHVYHDGDNDLSNCVPSCKICNSSKHDSEFEIWYNECNLNFSLERYNKIIRWINEDYINYIEI